jgi:hypothetical protein
VVRDRALPGGGSLAEREWDHRNGHKQKQVKGTPKKMRFDLGVSLFFHFDLILFAVLYFAIFYLEFSGWRFTKGNERNYVSFHCCSPRFAARSFEKIFQ